MWKFFAVNVDRRRRRINTFLPNTARYSTKLKSVRISGFRETWPSCRAEPVINEWHAFELELHSSKEIPLVRGVYYIPWSEQIYLELSWNAASKVIFVGLATAPCFSASRWKSDNRYATAFVRVAIHSSPRFQPIYSLWPTVSSCSCPVKQKFLDLDSEGLVFKGASKFFIFFFFLFRIVEN